jgi:shikimate kinase
VTVYEKEAVAGGQVYLGSRPPHKEKLNWCIEDLVTACEKLGVEIKYSAEVTKELIEKENPYAVICATGGSAVYGEEAMKKLRENGTVVYLKLPVSELEKRLSNIHTRGVAMKKGETIADLYEKRRPLYEKYADITLDCYGLTAEECVEKIISNI